MILTPSQQRAAHLLIVESNWRSTNHLMKSGANPASLLNLVKRGMAEQREVTSVNGYPHQEFRSSKAVYDGS